LLANAQEGILLEDIPTPARTVLTSDDNGHLTLGAVSHLMLGAASRLLGSPTSNFDDFLVELRRAENKVLIIFGQPPYPKVEDFLTLGLDDSDLDLDLVHGRTGARSKLFLASANTGRRHVAELVRPHLEDCVPPIVLVGGTRMSTIVFASGAYIIQVGSFSPVPYTEHGRSEDVGDSPYGGTTLSIDLDQPNNLVEWTFRAYGGE
jgi:hypothetical protein